MTTTTLTEAYYRRLYAFHEPTEDFFNHNHSPQDGKFTSGSGGRKRNIGKGSSGGKVWSGISADPDNRVRPKSMVSFPIEPEAYESPAEARAMFATRIYDADLGNGYQARVASVRDIPNGISVTVKIRKGHEEAALSTRELAFDGAGRLVAHHETLYVEPKHQGKGIADRFNAHAVAEYQRIGVDRIDLQAGDAVGGYAWARQGFRHFEGGRKKFLLTQLDRLDAQMKHPAPNLRPHAKKIKADSAALRKAIEAGEDVQPIHLASLGEKYARHTGRDDHGNEYPTWPGKSILIGTNWIGQYYFDATRVVTAAATDLEHAALRPAFRTEDEELACHDAACAPPPAGVGGSSPLQARRGAVAGYGPTGRRDITLGSVRVTYKPDYPDGHPDPGEVVWAKVRFQEDVNQSKDRPVLIIGRINGSDKLAAVQLTSNVTGRPDSMMIGTGSWDRLGRNSAVKLSQIIVVDPKDYRREGSKFERDKFEAVIGRLAAYHRTPVQIAASAHLEFYNHNHDRKDGRFSTGMGATLPIPSDVGSVMKKALASTGPDDEVFPWSKLARIYEARGFSGKAKIVSRSDLFDEFDSGRLREGWRGVRDGDGVDENAREYGRNLHDAPEHRPGSGVFGDGTYVALSISGRESVARNEASGYGTALTRMGLPKSITEHDYDDIKSVSFYAKRIAERLPDWDKQPKDNPMVADEFRVSNQRQYDTAKELLRIGVEAGLNESGVGVLLKDTGRVAALLGWDGYMVKNKQTQIPDVEYAVVLNRTALTLDESVYHDDGIRVRHAP